MTKMFGEQTQDRIYGKIYIQKYVLTTILDCCIIEKTYQFIKLGRIASPPNNTKQ